MKNKMHLKPHFGLPTGLIWQNFLVILSCTGILGGGLGKATTILDIQPQKVQTTVKNQKFQMEMTLINLNPQYNKWYILEFNGLAGQGHYSFHLENPMPGQVNVTLSNDFDQGLVLMSDSVVDQFKCRLWPKGVPDTLITKSKMSAPLVSLCADRLYLRNTIEGYQTTKEWAVEFLRDNIWGGESIATTVKTTIYKDKYLLRAALEPFSGSPVKFSNSASGKQQPPAALINNPQSPDLVVPEELGITAKSPEAGGQLFVGQWYAIAQQEHMLVSVMRPSDVSKKLMATYPDRVNPLDSVESEALVYLIAMDTEAFDFEFALGTEHPRLEWSGRADYSVRKHANGPDGFADSAPLARTGLVSPHDRPRVVAAFTGGFKRHHGAFRYGQLAQVNQGSHYGFLENGVVFSSLMPDLATILIDYDGKMAIRTWQQSDHPEQLRLKHARQNGVPIIEWDSKLKQGIPAPYVGNWKLGNWSGSENAEQRTLRSGICSKRSKGKKWWIYGYFSSVTPNAMARVFQAYQCDYVIHTDMNALEHTYFAHYIRKPGREKEGLFPEHLVQGMAILDKRFKGNVPRFVGYPDNRDFFYVLKK